MIPLFGLLILVGGTSDAKATDPTTPVELVDALNGGFGKHPHTRGSHAKGFCVSGKFTPAADAASLSKAPQFSKSVPLLGRFSTGGGNPKAADNSKGGRGLALRFDLGDGAASDFVPLSVPVFFAKTPAQVVEFLKVRTPPEGADKPDPAAIEAFSKANPETTRQAAWVKEHALPAGYAGKTHFGIHAFTLSNAAGEKKLVKLKAIPSDGEKELSDDEAKGTDFYEADFKERLANGPPSSSSSRSSARRATRQAIPRCDGTARTRGLPHRSASSRSTRSRPTRHAMRSPSCRPICPRGSQGLRMIRSWPRAPALKSCRSPAARNHRTESRRPSRHGRAKPRHDEFSAIWEAPASRPSALTGRRPDDISCRIALALRSWECQDGLVSFQAEKINEIQTIARPRCRP
ncbi:MAG: catalase, partial [Methyloceanibacter sp.]